MEDKIKGIVFLVVAGVLTVLLVAQYYVFIVEDESDDGDDGYYENVTLTIGFMEEVDSLNPYVGLNDASHFFYSLVYDGLMGVGADLEPEPNLAMETWAVPESDPDLSGDGLPYGSVWQYNITPNAQWSDGEQFDADDVVYNLNLNAQNYDFLWSYQPYTYFIQEAAKVDNLTVRVSFWDKVSGDPMPVAFGESIFVHMLPEHKLQELGGAEDIGFSWTGVFADEEIPIVGTGPWMVTAEIYEEWLEGDHITLVRNPNYHWGPDKDMDIAFGKLRLLFYQDSTSMTLALKAHELDIAKFPPQSYRLISSDVESGDLTNMEVYHGPSPSMPFAYIGINMNEAGPNLARLDKHIRQALAMATNKSAIVEDYYLGLADEGTTLIPPISASWHYEPTEAELFHYDMDAASSLLEASGYPDTNSDGIREAGPTSQAVLNGWVSNGTPLHFELLVRREYPEEKEIATYLKSQWQQIGVSITYKVLSTLNISDPFIWYNYDMQILARYQDTDPNSVLFSQSKAAWYGWSDTKYFNASYDENYNLTVSAMDPAERRIYADNCQRTLYDESPYIILSYFDQRYAWRTDGFSGWGDWAADPGRSLDSYWGGNPLFFELKPLISQPYSSGSSDAGILMMVPTGIVAAAFYVLGVWYLVKGGRKKA